MLNENAKKWVAALRSGQYKQCKNRLTHAGRYCCLGVACAISPLDRKKWVHDYTLPWQVMDWLGIINSQGEFGSVVEGKALTVLNDDDDLSFEEIADIIESEPAGLFRDQG